MLMSLRSRLKSLNTTRVVIPNFMHKALKGYAIEGPRLLCDLDAKILNHYTSIHKNFNWVF